MFDYKRTEDSVFHYPHISYVGYKKNISTKKCLTRVQISIFLVLHSMKLGDYCSKGIFVVYYYDLFKAKSKIIHCSTIRTAFSLIFPASSRFPSTMGIYTPNVYL